MLIVDSQVHIWENVILPPWHRQRETYSKDDLLAEMETAGVDAVLLHPPGVAHRLAIRLQHVIARRQSVNAGRVRVDSAAQVIDFVGSEHASYAHDTIALVVGCQLRKIQFVGKVIAQSCLSDCPSLRLVVQLPRRPNAANATPQSPPG